MFSKTGPNQKMISNQSDGRTETMDLINFKFSKSNVKEKTMKCQLFRCNALSIIDKLPGLKPFVISRAQTDHELYAALSIG